MPKKLMKGCEAIGEAAIKAGCRLFFGYPITPQNEIPEYMSGRLPQVGGTFVQAESEVAASNMLYGAAGAGCRCITSSSSPGISLMQEGISYLAASELPCVIVNIMRGGPGLGGILPSQADYRQAKGGGHGDYKVIVLAPATVQEAADLTFEAFELAEKYRTPVLIMGDGLIGQMMEPVEFKREIQPEELTPPEWATTGWDGTGERRIINSLYLKGETLEDHNWQLAKKYEDITTNEIRHATYNLESPKDFVIAAYGSVARICKTAIDMLKEEGIDVGLFRPISIFPFPKQELIKACENAKQVLVSELSMGQMVDDVRSIIGHNTPVEFYGRAGGVIMAPEEIVEKVKRLLDKEIEGESVLKVPPVELRGTL